MKNMENIPEELKQRMLDSLKKWCDMPVRPNTFLTESKHTLKFIEKKGVQPWMYERLIERFTEVVR